jgi:hypothetical protein
MRVTKQLYRYRVLKLKQYTCIRDCLIRPLNKALTENVALFIGRYSNHLQQSVEACTAMEPLIKNPRGTAGIL